LPFGLGFLFCFGIDAFLKVALPEGNELLNCIVYFNKIFVFFLYINVNSEILEGSTLEHD